ncbi:hypothetical protein V8D89_012549 [Ganoderma adspersum]
MFAFTMLARLFFATLPLSFFRIFFRACCRTVYQYHILVIIATHSSLANCALVFTPAHVFRGDAANAAAVSLPYICSPYCLLVSLAPLSPPHFSLLSLRPFKWHSGYLGLVYVVGFAPCLVFILATAYPTTPPDIPSTSLPFSSPGLWLQLAVSPTLVGEHLYILRRPCGSVPPVCVCDRS